ncbi:MAG: winged helix-turn-helix domain-containing protein [Candidatus Woesearchaeota archaeon]
MSEKRDRITIMNDMLEFIRSKGDKAKPTQVMYRANLSHAMLKEYLTELLEKQLITEQKSKDEKRTYSLTTKGFEFLKDYQQMRGFLESYDLT